MSQALTQAILTLFIGETYVEATLFELSADGLAEDLSNEAELKNSRLSKSHKKVSPVPILATQLYYLPHYSLKTIFNSIAKLMLDKNFGIAKIYLTTRYLERLQNYRLGGSIAQIVNLGFENKINFSNSLSLSLATPSLVFAKEDSEPTEEILDQDLAIIKKINPDCDKIVISHRFEQTYTNYFLKNGFQVFQCPPNSSASDYRTLLLRAGIEGTRKELFTELLAFFPLSEIRVWLQDQWILWKAKDQAEEVKIDSLELYHSGSQFLRSVPQFVGQKNDTFSSVFHFDFDNWEMISPAQSNETVSSEWQSPWGGINYVRSFERMRYSLEPRQEILIDDTLRLQVSKNSQSHETGPAMAGRSTKTLLLDLYYKEILSESLIHQMLGSPDQKNLQAKISSQFKVLEKGQKGDSADVLLNQEETKNLISQIILQRIELETGQDQRRVILTGHLNFLFESANLKSLKFNSWSQLMTLSWIHHS